MLTPQSALPYGAPAATVIIPGRAPWLILVPGMEQPEARNLGLTFFLQDHCVRAGRGFASFRSAKPEQYDDVAHSMATQATLREAMAAFGQRAGGLTALVAGSPRERVVVERAVNHAKGLPDMVAAPVFFTPQVYDSLPARVAFAKTLAQATSSLRNQRFAQLSRT